MSVLDPSLCRGCALNAESNQPLFYRTASNGSDQEMHLTDVAKLLSECLSIEIKSDDGYPGMICVHCQLQLKSYAEFKTSILRIHRHYTRRLRRISLPKQDHVDLDLHHLHDVVVKSELSAKPSSVNSEILCDSEEDQRSDKINDISLQRLSDNLADTEVMYVELISKFDDDDPSNEIFMETGEENSMEEIYLDEEPDQEEDSRHDPPMSEPMVNLVINQEKTMVPLKLTMASVQRSSQNNNVQETNPKNVLAASSKTPNSSRLKPESAACQCPLCGLCFNSKRALKSHDCSEFDNRQLTCKICDNTFKTSYSLKEHMMRHTGARLFNCDDCAKSFKTPADLYVHRRIHSSNLRKYICDTCGYACRSSSHLVHHMVIHSDARPFKCEMCSKSFKRKDTLEGHIMSLHTDKTDRAHVCQVCGTSFGLKQRLTRHMKMHIRLGELNDAENEATIK